VYAGPWLPGVPKGAVPLRGLRSAAAGDASRNPDPAGEALVIFTSGTTDAPKAVVHSRASLGAGLADFAAGVGIRAGQRVLTDQLMVGVPALIAGAHWTIPPAGANPGARPEQYLRLLPEAELLFAVPAALDAILRALDRDPRLTPGRLDTVVLGGAPVLRPLLERIVARFPAARIRAVYGMTEILPVAIADGVEKLRAEAGEGDLVGRVVPSVTARIVDDELVLAGPGLAPGYLGGDDLAELATGDLARLDGDRLTLLGRRKEMFIRGTQNIYPGLYEPIVAGLPGVAEAAMAGVPDAVGDDRIVLAIVPEGEATGLADRVARALPGLIDAGALPDEVVVVPELPRSGRSRKLDRARLAELVRGRP
jgi:acyl-CoA synthetase (AMP-forming)/AMP-acid ligase II